MYCVLNYGLVFVLIYPSTAEVRKEKSLRGKDVHWPRLRGAEGVAYSRGRDRTLLYDLSSTYWHRLQKVWCGVMSPKTVVVKNVNRHILLLHKVVKPLPLPKVCCKTGPVYGSRAGCTQANLHVI